MVEKIIEGLLPGTRSLRPPLIGGILWCHLLWLILAEYIPLASESEGWFQQFYILFDALGPIAGLAVASILVFIIGASLGNVSDGFSKLTGIIATRIQETLAWHKHAKMHEHRLRISLQQSEGALERVRKIVDDGPARADRLIEQQIPALENTVNGLKNQLRALEDAKIFQFLIRPTRKAQRSIGVPPLISDSTMEHQLVEDARRRGQEAAQAERERFFSKDELMFYEDTHNDGFVIALSAELRFDPLEVLRSLDETLFLELDRHRAEREVRLSFATPLMGLAVYGAVQLSAPGVILIALLPLFIIFRYSYEAQQERQRVLQLMGLRKFQTPTLDRAFEEGRRDIMRTIKEAGE